MKRYLPWGLILGGFLSGIVLGTLVLMFSSRGNAATPRGGRVSPYVGAASPDFRLPTLKGETVTLSEFRGRPVVINWEACRHVMSGI